MKQIPFAISSLLMASTILALAYFLMTGAETSPVATPVTARQLDAFHATALPDLDGRIQPLEQWRGKVLVVNYWATWCPPCLEEMPMFSTLQKRYADRGVQFVGIANDDAGKVREFARKTPVAYPLLIGGFDSFAMTVELGNTAMGLPFTVVLDRDGKVHEAMLGGVHQEKLTRLLDVLAQRP